MKSAVNFRLNQQAMSILFTLEKKLHISRTTVVEKALQAYYSQTENTKISKNPLMHYAGILSDQESSRMQLVIKNKKNNKNININL